MAKRRTRKTSTRKIVEDYYGVMTNIQRMQAMGQLPPFNFAAIFNEAALYMRGTWPIFPYENMTDEQKDIFFLRKNEYIIINKVFNKIMRDFQNGRTISENFSCEIEDNQAYKNAMYRLTSILFYTVLPVFQQWQGFPYSVLTELVKNIINNYYSDVKDDLHIPEIYREPTLGNLVQDTVGDTAAQNAQLKKFEKISPISHEFMVYKSLSAIEKYIRMTVLKHYPKNTTRTLQENTENSLLSAIQIANRSNHERSIVRRIDMLKNISDYLDDFLVQIDQAFNCSYISYQRYVAIAKMDIEVERMIVSLINKLTAAYINGFTDAYEAFKQTEGTKVQNPQTNQEDLNRCVKAANTVQQKVQNRGNKFSGTRNSYFYGNNPNTQQTNQ